jgi:hypothetical protein
MNSIHSTFRGIKLMLLIILSLLGQSSLAYAKNTDCWADFYEYAQFIGDHFRIQGPKEIPNLRNVNGENWESRIDSIIVGPKARVIIFENIDYKLTLTEMAKYPVLMNSLGITEKDIKEDSELIFDSESKPHHLGEYNFHKKTKSLKVQCIK